MPTGVAYKGGDNVVTVLFKDGDAAVSLANMTKVKVTIGAVTIDSSVAEEADFFDLTEKADGKIGLKLGAVPDLATGEHNIRVVVFDDVNTAGIVWSHESNVQPTTIRVLAAS